MSYRDDSINDERREARKSLFNKLEKDKRTNVDKLIADLLIKQNSQEWLLELNSILHEGYITTYQKENHEYYHLTTLYNKDKTKIHESL